MKGLNPIEEHFGDIAEKMHTLSEQCQEMYELADHYYQLLHTLRFAHPTQAAVTASIEAGIIGEDDDRATTPQKLKEWRDALWSRCENLTDEADKAVILNLSNSLFWVAKDLLDVVIFCKENTRLGERIVEVGEECLNDMKKEIEKNFLTY